MPKLVIAPGINDALSFLESGLTAALSSLASATVTTSPTEAVWSFGPYDVTLAGTGIAVVGGIPTATSISSLTFEFSDFPGYTIEFSEFEFTLADLVAAFAGEAVSTDSLETFLGRLDWTIVGNHTSETLLINTKTSDGSKLRLDGNDYVKLGEGRDNFFAAGGNDTIFGGRDNDTISGGRGDDLIVGGGHGDHLYGDRGNDSLDGGSGRDILNGGAGKDWLFGGRGKDLLKGHEGRDRLFGEEDNDSLNGGDGKDTLDGGAGDDFLQFASGHDRATGGAGSDLFAFFEIDTRNVSAVITDFTTGEDEIRVYKTASSTVDLTTSTDAGNARIDFGVDSFVILQGGATITSVALQTDGNGAEYYEIL